MSVTILKLGDLTLLAEYHITKRGTQGDEYEPPQGPEIELDSLECVSERGLTVTPAIDLTDFLNFADVTAWVELEIGEQGIDEHEDNHIEEMDR